MKEPVTGPQAGVDSEAVFWITPHTWEHTHLHAARIGQTVNLEADMLAKHVVKLLAARLG